MDFHGNNVHHLGHGHPEVIAAIKRQLDELSFAPRRFAPLRAVELAEALNRALPRADRAAGRVLFTTGGSDAVEVALKLARAATGRFKTLSFWDAFHGAGMGASSVGGESLFRSGRLGPLLPGSEHVAPFGCYRCAYGHEVDAEGQPNLEQCKLACASMVRYVLEREGDVAAVIAEPARAVPFIPPPGYWQAVREACHAHGTLLIFDEIPTGLGKTGRFFAAEHDATAPDIVVLGKALGGGVLPIAACIARDDLNVAGDFALGHYTHEKNPVTAAAALATLQVIERDGLVDECRACRRACAGAAAGHEAAPPPDRRRARPRPAAGHRTGRRPRRQDAGPRGGRTRAVPRAVGRPVVQDHDGQCADLDPTPDHHPATDGPGARHPRALAWPRRKHEYQTVRHRQPPARGHAHRR